MIRYPSLHSAHSRLEQRSVWIWKLSRELLLERRVYYLFSTFLCQDRLTFLGHNLSNPETMCHNVSVCQNNRGQNQPNIPVYLYFSVTQFPLFSTDCFWSCLNCSSRSGFGLTELCDGEQTELWEQEMRKLSREESGLMWLIWLDTELWPRQSDGSWSVQSRAEAEWGVRGGSPGNCLTRSRPRTRTSGA